MEDGEVIDAHLQQARAHLISYCLRSSSRLFSSEVAHAFTHDLFTPDLESYRFVYQLCVPSDLHVLYLPYFSRQTAVLAGVLHEQRDGFCFPCSPLLAVP